MTEKAEILGKLYSLRAGLSVVSIEKDKIDKLTAAAVSKKDNELSEAKNSIETKWETLNNAKSEVKNIENEFNYSLSNGRFYGECFINFLYILLDIFIICLAIAFVLYFVWLISGVVVMSCRPSEQISEFEHAIFDCLEKDVPDWLVVVVLILFFAALPAAVGCIIILKTVIVNQIDNDYDSIFKIFSFKKERHRAKVRLSKARAELAKAQDIYNREKNELPRRIGKIKQEYINSINRIVPRVNLLIFIINILDKTFFSLIDNRDWENVDLIIYYIETTRADSMKEALQLTDRERQTQRIIQSVEMATMEISRTLNTGFARLQDTMKKGFDEISNQIYASSQRIAGKLDGIMAQNSMISSQIQQGAAQMLTATSMTNALLAKSNVTSTEIAGGVNEISGYVKQLEMLKRNS